MNAQGRVCRVVLLGPPGAGKGTQAVLISSTLKIPHISTGEIMRNAVANKTPLGLEVKSFLDSGNLVPDSLVINLMRERLSQKDCENGFLLDGFPRTLEQAKQLDVLLKEINSELTHIIDISVAESILLDRIKKRGEAGSGRSDDNVEVAAKRLQVYWAQTAPVSEYYKQQNRLIAVDGLGTVEEVQQRIMQTVKA